MKVSIFLLFFVILMGTSATTNTSIAVPCIFETTYSLGYSCFILRLFVSTHDKTVSKITGANTRNNSTLDVRYLKVDESVVLYLPSELGKFFPKIETFRIEQAKLREIHQKDLPFENLERFYAEGNDIQVLEKDLFKLTPKLKSISIKHNHLKHVDPNVFEHLSSLDFLSFTINPCLPQSSISFRHTEQVIEEVKENCPPRDDGSSDWKLNDDEHFPGDDEDCGCGIFIFFNFILLIFISAGSFFAIRKKKITLTSIRESVFYGRL